MRSEKRGERRETKETLSEEGSEREVGDGEIKGRERPRKRCGMTGDE